MRTPPGPGVAGPSIFARRRPDLAVVLLLAAAVASAGSAEELRAQMAPAPGDTAELEGRVVRAGSLEPVANARVEIVELDRAVLTDGQGRYLIARLPAGSLTVRASFLGGRTTERTVELGPGEIRDLRLEVEADVIELEALDITVRGRLPGTLEAFARRVETGHGRIVPREEVETHRGTLTRLVARKNVYGPGLRIRSLRPGGGYCEPAYFVNGSLVSGHAGASRAPGTGTLDRYRVEEVSAVEIHPPEGLPRSLQRGRAVDCGAIVVWERAYVQGGRGWRR